MEIDIKISSEQTIEHNGKQYRPVAIRSPKQGETFLSAGECYLANANYRDYASVILEEVIPPYRTPTDEDAKQRPMAEFWGRDESPGAVEWFAPPNVTDRLRPAPRICSRCGVQTLFRRRPKREM